MKNIKEINVTEMMEINGGYCQPIDIDPGFTFKPMVTIIRSLISILYK